MNINNATSFIRKENPYEIIKRHFTLFHMGLLTKEELAISIHLWQIKYNYTEV